MRFKLMKNTKTGAILRYNEAACTRMKNLQPLTANEVTNEELQAAGLLGYVDGLVTEAEVVLPEETPASDESVVEEAVDPSKWTEEQLDAFITKEEIPVHPAAKSAGKLKAVVRFLGE